MTETRTLERRIRYVLLFFVAALVASGLTAFPLKWEVTVLQSLFGRGSFIEGIWPAMAAWISFVYQGLMEMYAKYPFIAYGTDWLAFAHLMIAVAFWGPLRDPIKHIWVVEWGMICCVMLIPLALICGPIRGIPFVWRLFDCAFGVFGILPLLWVRRDILRLKALRAGG
jgi:hypothetical protein